MLYGPSAKFSSGSQYEMVTGVLKGTDDIVAILPTGSGKSLAWLAAAIDNPSAPSVVVVPFKSLLTQHLNTARAHSISVMQWTVSVRECDLNAGTSLYFAAPESVKTPFFTQ